MTEYICHAFGCPIRVEPKLLMCSRHWFILPKNMREAVWRHYRAGQEVDKKPTAEYLAAARRAIVWVQAWEVKDFEERAEHDAQNPSLF